MDEFSRHKVQNHLSFLKAIPLNEGGWVEFYTCTIRGKEYELGQIVRFHFYFADGLKYEELKSDPV